MQPAPQLNFGVSQQHSSMSETDPKDVSRDEVRASNAPFDRTPFDHQHCMLCGREFADANGTREHVFPAWLQRRFGLWEQQIVLLNGTALSYRQLTVPCCQSCNGGPLSQLEDEVRRGLEGGHAQLSQLPKLRLFQWTAKLLFGILFKEISLALDRSTPDSPPIVPPAFLDNFTTLHDLLQSVRVPARFEGGPIYSIIVAPLHDLGNSHSFHFADSVDDQVVALRLGGVGIVASLADAGLAEHHWSSVLAAYGGHPLHPIQFDEIVAHVVATKQRMTRTVKLIMSANIETGADLTFIRMPLMGFSARPILRPFDAEELRPMLRHFMQAWGSATTEVWGRSEGLGTTIFAEPGHVALCDTDFAIQRIVKYE